MTKTNNTKIKLESKIKQLKKRRIVLFSDTHIERHNSAFNLHAFNVGMEKINAIKNVDLYLHLGDVTHNGTLMDYEFAQKQMNKLEISPDAHLRYVIGNHDAKNVGYILFEEFFGNGKRHFEYEEDDIYIIGIDSTKPDLPGGVIHHDTIDAVRRRLEQRKDKLRIVCFHHQLLPIPNTGRERSAIDDSGNMLKMLLDVEADLVINGHRHSSNLYSLNSPRKDFHIFNAGTFSCNKTRYREQFTYNVVDIKEHHLNFKVRPVFKKGTKKEIEREIKRYRLRSVEEEEKPYFRIIQLTNTFITAESKQSTLNFLRAIDEINRIENVDLVIHNGNLTCNSFKEEFKAAADYIQDIKPPFVATPGYSDSKPPAWIYWKKYIGELDPIFETDKLYFQGINSTTQDSKAGFIGRKKMRKLMDQVLSYGYDKIYAVGFYHNLIPTPLSVWRTDLMDAGDALSQFSRSQIALVFNGSPSISFSVKIGNSVFSNGGNIMGEHFEPVFNEIEIYEDGLVRLIEHNIASNERTIIGKYCIQIPEK
ncbi:MAG: metallophosphoesterase family protein [Promethearchaeia archaeon]